MTLIAGPFLRLLLLSGIGRYWLTNSMITVFFQEDRFHASRTAGRGDGSDARDAFSAWTPGLRYSCSGISSVGRSTLNGRIVVSGRSLEETEIWKRDHSYRNADLIDVLASAGIKAELVGIDAVRAGGKTLASAMEQVARSGPRLQSATPRLTTTL